MFHATRTSTISAAAGPTDISVLLRRPDQPLRYQWWLRLVDVVGGRRDGRRRVAGDAEGQRLGRGSTTWLRHNNHRLEERVHWETARHDALALALHREDQALPGLIRDAKRERNAARAALATLPPQPSEPTARRATEITTPVEVVRVRRVREYKASLLDPAQSRALAAEAELARLRAKRRDVRALLAALERVHTERTGRLTEFHQRRAHAYERAYLRHATAVTTDLP